MDKNYTHNTSGSQKGSPGDEVLREVCSCNGLNYQELLDHGRSDATGIEMFFGGYSRIVGLNYFPYLQYLCIVDQNITKIENICCPLLKELWISETKVAQIEGLQDLHELRKLYLYSNQIKRIEKIGHLQKLEVLWLSSNQIEAIEGLTNLCHLRELNLSNNRLTRLGRSLLANTELETLMVAGNQLSDLKDIKNLADLQNLRNLSLKDPQYPNTNGVALLYNYAIYVLYHIPQLTILDSYHVENRQLKDFCEAVISKKRSFYRMRLQALKRDYIQSVKFVERVRQPLSRVCVDRLSLFHQELLQLERKLSGKVENTHLVNAFQLANVEDSSIEQKIDALKARIQQWNDVYEHISQEYLHVVRDLKSMASFKLRLLELEWTTAGNVRMNESRARSRTTPWLFAAVSNLVRSRFQPFEYVSNSLNGAVARCGHSVNDSHAPTGIRVKTVIRLQNRHLQTRFQESLFSHLQSAFAPLPRNIGQSVSDYPLLPNDHVIKYKKYVNYLFWMNPSTSNASIMDAIERGFAGTEPDAGIQLTNSVYLADQAHLRDRCWRCELAARASRSLLICRTYLGKFVTFNNNNIAQLAGVSNQSATPKRQDFEKDITAAVKKLSRSVSPPPKDNRRDCNTSCNCACHDEPHKLGTLVHDNHCQYFVFERDFVLPEYLVEFEYVYGGPQVDETNIREGETYLHRLLSVVMGQSGLNGSDYSSTRSVLRELATQVCVEDSPYDYAESEQYDAKMIAAYNKLMRLVPSDVLSVFNSDFKGDSQAFAISPSLLNAAADANSPLETCVKQPVKISKLNEESLAAVLGPQIKSKSFHALSYLNVTGVGLSSLSDVNSLSGLKTLIACCNELQLLDEVSHMHLEHLDVSFNRITTLEGMTAMHRLLSFSVCGNQLTRFANEMMLLRQHAQQLKTLDIRYNPWQWHSSALSLDVQEALMGEESQNDADWKQAAFVREMKSKLAIWLRNLVTLNGASLSDDDNVTAVKHAAASGAILTQSSLLNHARTDLVRRRGLTLLTDAQQIATLSYHKPERLHDQDVTWFEKITCLVVDHSSITVLNNLERLNTLRWASFDCNDIVRVDSLESSACEHLEELSLSQNALMRVDELSRLSRIASLALSSNYISHIDPITFTNWSGSLTYLALDSNRINSLRGFDRLNALCELYVAHNQISNVRELFYLKSLTRLLILDVAYNPVCIDTENFRSFVIYHLRALKALNGQLIESHEANFARELFGGRLTCDFISEKLALSSTEFSEVTELDVANQSLRTVDLGLNCAQTFSALRSVNLEHNNLTSFSGLIYLPNLKVLCLNYNKIECIIPPTPTGGKLQTQANNATSAPPLLERLEVLYLGSNQIRDLVALQLYRLPSLRSLFLHCNEITKLEGLEGLKNLRELVLDKNKLSTIPEQAFLTNWNLVELHIEDNRLKDLLNLNVLEKLQRLYLGGNRVHALSEIRKLDGLQNLLELSLFANPVTRHHDYRLSVLQRLQNLKVLDGLPITDDERLRAEMYLLEQQALQQAAQTGTLEVLAPSNDLALPSNSLVLGRNVSMPIKITNVHLFSMQNAQAQQAMLAAQNASAQSNGQLSYSQLPLGVPMQSSGNSMLEMNMIRKQQPATMKYNQPQRNAKQPGGEPASNQFGSPAANGGNHLGSANSGKLSLAQRYQRVQTRIAALENARNNSQYTSAQDEISRFLKNPKKE